MRRSLVLTFSLVLRDKIKGSSGHSIGLISQLNSNVRKPVNSTRKNVNECYNRKPDSIVEDILSSTDHEDESTIFNEKPHHRHNDSSVSSQRMRHINNVEVPNMNIIDLEAARRN